MCTGGGSSSSRMSKLRTKHASLSSECTPLCVWRCVAGGRADATCRHFEIAPRTFPFTRAAQCRPFNPRSNPSRVHLAHTKGRSSCYGTHFAVHCLDPMLPQSVHTTMVQGLCGGQRYHPSILPGPDRLNRAAVQKPSAEEMCGQSQSRRQLAKRWPTRSRPCIGSIRPPLRALLCAY